MASILSLSAMVRLCLLRTAGSGSPYATNEYWRSLKDVDDPPGLAGTSKEGETSFEGESRGLEAGDRKELDRGDIAESGDR